MCRNDDVEEKKNTIISTQKLHEEASPIDPISKAFFVIPSYEHKGDAGGASKIFYQWYQLADLAK